jgi:hypothetical protein
MSNGDGRPRPLSDVEWSGAAAAREVFDRLVAELDTADARGRLPGADGDGAGEPAGIPQLRAAVARTVDVYADLFRRTLEVYADVVEGAVRAGVPGTGAGATESHGDAIALAGAAGTSAVAVVWIHNATAAPVDVVLRITDLTAHDGARVAAPAARFESDRLHVDAGASRSASLTVDLPAATAPGAYVGHVLAQGLPEASLAVRLVVAP